MNGMNGRDGRDSKDGRGGMMGVTLGMGGMVGTGCMPKAIGGFIGDKIGLGWSLRWEVKETSTSTPAGHSHDQKMWSLI